jgi:hypothetical protein
VGKKAKATHWPSGRRRTGNPTRFMRQTFGPITQRVGRAIAAKISKALGFVTSAKQLARDDLYDDLGNVETRLATALGQRKTVKRAVKKKKGKR